MRKRRLQRVILQGIKALNLRVDLKHQSDVFVNDNSNIYAHNTTTLIKNGFLMLSRAQKEFLDTLIGHEGCLFEAVQDSDAFNSGGLH